MKKMENAVRTMSNPDLLRDAKVGSRIWFEEEMIGYNVQARSDNFIVCTKPFALRKTVLYTVIDIERDIRGTENLVFGGGAETQEQCEEMIARLTGKSDIGWATEVSHRNNIPLRISKIAY